MDIDTLVLNAQLVSTQFWQTKYGQNITLDSKTVP